MKECYKDRAAHNGFWRYIFNFRAGDFEEGIFDDQWPVFSSGPLTFEEIENIWAEAAEVYEQGFWRGDVEVHYPFCYIPVPLEKFLI